MDEAGSEAYKRAGATETTLEEWLGLTEVDNEVIEFRHRVAREIRRRRETAGMSVEEFAARYGTTRSVVDRIESGVESSYNRMMKVYFDCGAKVEDLTPRPQVPAPA